MPPRTLESTPLRQEDRVLGRNLLPRAEGTSIHTVCRGGHDRGQGHHHHHLEGGEITPGSLAPDPDLGRHRHRADKSPLKNLPLALHRRTRDEITLRDRVPGLDQNPRHHTQEETTTPVHREDHHLTPEDRGLKTTSSIGITETGEGFRITTFIKGKKQRSISEHAVLQLPKNQVVEALVPALHLLAKNLHQVDSLLLHHKWRQTLKN